MAGCKYFVWGGGRWRGVELSSGAVCGWRRARFVFVSRRRLVLARRARVLAALRALAKGLPGPAADGARLPYYRKAPRESPKRLESEGLVEARLSAAWASLLCAHSHSCNKEYCQSRCDVGTHYEAQTDRIRTDASVQCDRHDLSDKSADQHDLSNKTPDRHPTLVQTSTKQAGSSSEEEAICELTISDSDVKALRGFIAKSRPEALQRFNVDIAYRRALFYAINPTVSLKRCARLEQALVDREAGVLPHFAARLGLSPAPSSGSAANKPTRSRNTVLYAEPTSESDTDKENINARRRSRRVKTNSQESENSPRFTQIHNQNTQRKHKIHENDKTPENEIGKKKKESGIRSEKAKIGEVETNRVETKQAGSKTSEKVGSDRKNTERVGSKTSVVVKVGLDKQNTVQVGSKTSVIEKVESKTSEVAKVGSHKQKTEPVGSKTTEVERVKKKLGSKREETQQVGPKRAKIERSGSHQAKQAIEASDDSDEDALKRKTPVVAKSHSICKPSLIAGTKEYSNLEDHAIVSYISNGNRASLVNGNKVWQLLQEQYTRLTGVCRSWHSLRNRYLRYILPSLGLLGLPPEHTARLRAGAALGVAKARLGNRRASIHNKVAPLTGASTRQPRPAPASPANQARPASPASHTSHTRPGTRRHSSDTEEEISPRRSLRVSQPNKPARKGVSPRYSEVTRRFAAKHPPTSATSTPTPTPTPTPTTPTKPHTRKLFNPNNKV